MSDNPYRSPESPGSPANNRRLHRRAKVFLAVAVVCFASAAVFLVSGKAIRRYDIARYMATGMSRAEAVEHAGWSLHSIALPGVGLLSAAVGAAVGAPSAIIWFLTRQADDKCQEQR